MRRNITEHSFATFSGEKVEPNAGAPKPLHPTLYLLVGSSISRTFSRGDGSTVAYTPRGYAKKRETRQ